MLNIILRRLPLPRYARNDELINFDCIFNAAELQSRTILTIVNFNFTIMKTKQPLSLTQLELFALVANKQSFTKAAEQVQISRAAISQAVKALEDQLGVDLFIRTTRKVLLTEEGDLLKNQYLRVQEELTLTKDLVSNFHAKPRGILKISCNALLAETQLLNYIQHYQKKFPDVSIDLQIEERMPDMKAEAIDIVFGVNWTPPEDVVAKRIADTRYVLCASSKYLKKYGKPKTLKDLEQHFYIPHSGRNRQAPIVDLKNKTAAFKLNSKLQINNIQLMKEAALRSLGIIQLHEYVVHKELESGELVEILPEVLTGKVPILMFYQKHRFVQPKIRAWVNLVGEDCSAS